MKIGTDFSGIGSPESALKRLGLDIEEVFACEIDKYARKSFNELHNPTTFYEDITTRNHSEVPQLDLYVAGFPCQSFSMAGKRGGFEDTRGTLFFNVAEFIKENQPKCFVLENVKGLLSHDSGKTYQTITDVLTNGGGTLNGQIGIDTIDNGLGYHVYAKVLNTKDYGVPQNRERIFLVGFKEPRDFNFPKKMELKLRLKDLLESDVDEKYYIENISNNDRLYKTVEIHKDNMSDNTFIDSYNKTIHKTITPTITTRINASSQCHIYKEVKIIQVGNLKEDVGFKNKQAGRVYSIEGLSPCLSTMQGGGQEPKALIEKKIRRLTPLECWRLQGFTDEQFYKAQKVNSDTQLYKQAGNSITVNVLVELFKKIYLCKN